MVVRLAVGAADTAVAGWVKVAVFVPVQPLPSFTVMVYVPDVSPLNVPLAWKAPPSE